MSSLKMCACAAPRGCYKCARCNQAHCVDCDRPRDAEEFKTVVRYCPDWRCQRERSIEFGLVETSVKQVVGGPTTRAMRSIPTSAARRIAEQYGYDQVVIIARKVGAAPDPHGEHITSYGVSKEHCDSAAKQVAALKRFMGWPGDETPEVSR